MFTPLLTKVHHVTYVVENVQEIRDYLEKNFGMKPEMAGESKDYGVKFVLYKIGETIADFFEPTREDIGYAKLLRESGPGVAHVAWGVEGIDQVYEDLVKKGNNMGGFGQGKPGSSPFHYKVASVDPGSSKGVYLQLAEGEAYYPSESWEPQGSR